MTHSISLTDSHCHLDFPQFAHQLHQIVDRAIKADVRRMLTICTTTAGLDDVKTIAAAYPCVSYAYGLHPLHVHEQELISEAELLGESAMPKMIGIGETGLDYHYSSETRARQIESLHIHISAAQKSGLPLIIHSRAADDDMKAILTERYKEAEYGCVMHCFSSGEALAKAALDCGFYLSMSGVTTFKNAESLRDIFKKAPIERILIETDAPYLAPVPHRGKTNEPAYVRHTAEMAANLFGMSLADFAKQTEENFEALFSKATSAELEG